MPEVQYRIVEAKFSSNSPGDVVLELVISTGYQGVNGWVDLERSRHTLQADNAKEFFYGQPNGSVPRIVDMTAALYAYLASAGAVDVPPLELKLP